jgi:hypothetical protein
MLAWLVWFQDVMHVGVVQAAFAVIYVDDPRAFRALKRVWPEARIVQDPFHLIDRFSREIDADNSLKGKPTGCSYRERPSVHGCTTKCHTLCWQQFYQQIHLVLTFSVLLPPLFCRAAQPCSLVISQMQC